MKYYLTFIFCSIYFLTFSQKRTTTKPFIYLYDGGIVKAKNITYKEPRLFKKSYLLVDNERYEIKEVKFYSNSNGYYANSKKFIQSDFLKRKKAGKLDIYHFIYSTTSTTTSQGGMSTTRNSTKVEYFYNVGYGDLKKVKYNNLKNDITDNAEAMIHLDKYKRSRNIKRGLLFGGLGLMLSTVLYVEDAQPLASAASTVGAGSLLTGFLWGMNREKHLYKAVETYNGFSIW